MRRVILTTLMLAAPRAALACPVCFGQNDSPLASGINRGILAMLVLTGGVLVSFAAFIIHLVRRARANADVNPADANFVSDRTSEGGAYAPRAQGGTV